MKYLFLFIFVLGTLATPAYALDRELLLVQNTADKGDLSLEGLGFNTETPAVRAENQKLLEDRAWKLKTHQKLGLLTLALMAATVATAEEGKEAPESHETLGYATAASYFTTAYFSLTAPETEAMEKKSHSGWNMKVHKAMAFIHFPAMLLLPFAGKKASDDYRDGKPASGLGKEKTTLAGLAVGSMAIAALSVAIDF